MFSQAQIRQLVDGFFQNESNGLTEECFVDKVYGLTLWLQDHRKLQQGGGNDTITTKE